MARQVWKAGGLIFGDKWILKHGEFPSGEWWNVFMGFDDLQITSGVNRMRKDAEAKIRIGDEAWPPTAFEFACYCKTVNSLYFHSPALTPPEKVCTREFALEQISEIKKRLNQ